MSIYLDTSVLIALFVADPHGPQAEAISQIDDALLVSDFAKAEFSSAIAGFYRMGRVTAGLAQRVFADFDVWIARASRQADIEASDVRTAEALMRRLDLTLRTPDAMHIAAAARLGARLATFDLAMTRAAEALGVDLASG